MSHSNDPKLLMINCAGGLNLTATTAELFQNPGYARVLENFESSYKGGYRRINGYTRFGDTQPAGTSNTITGVYYYAGGVIAVQEDSGGNSNLYWSDDGSTWIQLNKQGASAGLSITSLNSATQTTRTPGGRSQFVLFDGISEYGDLIISDGINYTAWLKFTGSGGSRTYYYDEITTPATSQWCEVYKDRLILGGDTNNPETVYWSHTNAPTDFAGANAGSIELPSNINGIKVWRDKLFVFGEYQIDEISGIVANTATSSLTVGVINVSKNIGCINGFSIQEVGGDLVYLSIDGLRNIAGTDQIDDVALTSVSRPIQPIIQDLLSSLNTLDISSMTIRDKSQYRLYYTKSTFTTDAQLGLIGTMKLGANGLAMEWSRIRGIPVSCSTSVVYSGDEYKFHGGYDGYVYEHDTGSTFNGSDIKAYYESPEIDYGNLAVRNTLHWIKLSGIIEGDVNEIRLQVSYNFGDSTMTHQPGTFIVNNFGSVATYGSATYGTSSYTGESRIERKINVVGAGFSNKFRWYSEGTQAPYSIQSYMVKYFEGAVQ